MRIGLVIYGSLDQISGGYLYDRMLVEHLRGCGDQVEVISIPRRGYIRQLGDNLSKGLLRRLSASGLDVVLQDELNHPSLIWTNLRLRRRQCAPIVSVVHNLQFRERRPAWGNWVVRLAERRYLKTVDAFVYNSEATRAEVTALVGPGRPGHLAYPAGDHLGSALSPTRIAARARAPGPLRVVFVGNLAPNKGLDVLLLALARLPSGCWRLSVIGSSGRARSYATKIRRQIRRAGIEGQVSMLGPLAGAEVERHLAASHVLAVPSRYEGFGIAYLEGMAFGLPAIASAAGGAPEIIDHGRNGFLVHPGDAAALNGYLRALAEDRERLLAMGLAARGRFLRHPGWAETSRGIRGFLQSLLA